MHPAASFAILTLLAGAPPSPTPAGAATVQGVRNFARVSPVLYRGAQPTRAGFLALRDLGVKTIVDLRSVHSDAKRLKGTGLDHYRIRTNQWNPETEDVVRALKVILTPEHQPVFVHCQAGQDRTGLIVAVYQILEGGRSVDEAIKERRAFGAKAIWEENEDYLERLRDPKAVSELRASIAAAPPPEVAPGVRFR